MISEKALKKARILVFWEKHGLQATLDAFPVKRRILYLWKSIWKKSGGKPEALNDKSKAPKTKRVRIWDEKIIAEIKRLRWEHPNLGKDKIHPELLEYCFHNNLDCPKISTIGRIVKDLGGLRMFPQKISHFGKIKPIKRQKKLRKPKDFEAEYPGHLVALDTIEEHIQSNRRYVISFEDIYTRFGFAWSTKSHASQAAAEFFQLCLKIFPFPIQFVLTDNGSEFAKEFSKKLKELHLTHYHTYPRTPKMNAHCERFNRTLREEFMDFHKSDLLNPTIFNNRIIDYLVWYNTKRVHYAFKNQLSPIQFILSLQTNNFNLPQECKVGWTYTSSFFILQF
jgi:transposase InsO family protein